MRMATEETLRLTVAALMQATAQTQTDLAQAIGLTQAQISRRQTGRASWTLDDCDRLADHYGIPVLTLLAGPTTACQSLPADKRRTTPPTTPPHAKTPAPPASINPQPRDTPTTPEPCVLCGAPATDHLEGFPQHLDPADCQPHPPRQQPSAPHPHHRPDTANSPQTPHLTPSHSSRRTHQGFPAETDLIRQAVQQALADHAGDINAATTALLRRAIPDAMALLDSCRIGARYDVISHPPLPDILRKKTSRGADDVWEARPRWTRTQLPPGRHEVTALDVNGAYLSALKTHLPLGALEYSTGNAHSQRRSGIHLITPPAWEHDSYLPNPLGARDEPGPLWITEPSLRLLQRLSSDKYGRLCEPPVIHESFTSGSTEHLFEKFRQVLRDARQKAIADDDEITLEYVKAMYSKFVSTMGESNFNREMYRPDWMHIVRAQAFVNLWLKAHKAHMAGLTVMRVMGTDELHVIGDWRAQFIEGRGVSQVKVKDVYTAGTRGQ